MVVYLSILFLSVIVIVLVKITLSHIEKKIVSKDSLEFDSDHPMLKNLSAGHIKVLNEMLKGFSAKETATNTGFKVATVRSYMQEIRELTDTKSVIELFRKLISYE